MNSDSELEAKFKVSRKEVFYLKRHLKKLKAKKRYERQETNIYFDIKSTHQDNNELLRLRKAYYDHKKIESIVTFKRKQERLGDNLKHRDEIEFYVSDGDSFIKMINAMGYKKIFSFEKKRCSYLLNQCLVEIDEIPKLGFYCEVEGENKELIEDVLARIGYADVQLISSGYGALIKKFLNKRNFELRF